MAGFQISISLSAATPIFRAAKPSPFVNVTLVTPPHASGFSLRNLEVSLRKEILK